MGSSLPDVAIAAIVLALVVVVVFVNNNWMYKFFDRISLLRRVRVTRETSYCICSGTRRSIGLCWPTTSWCCIWTGSGRLYRVANRSGPATPPMATFELSEGEWLTDDGRQPLAGVDGILIPVGEVEMVCHF